MRGGVWKAGGKGAGSVAGLKRTRIKRLLSLFSGRERVLLLLSVLLLTSVLEAAQHLVLFFKACQQPPSPSPAPPHQHRSRLSQQTYPLPLHLLEGLTTEDELKKTVSSSVVSLRRAEGCQQRIASQLSG